jgi:putative nucleotidyltransferase with HDIG domain
MSFLLGYKAKLFKYIQLKISFFALILIAIITLMSYFITVQIINQYVMSEVIKRAEALSRSIAALAGYSFLSEDVLGLDNMVFRIKNSNRDVEYIAIAGTDHSIVVHSDISMRGKLLAQSAGQLFRKREDGTVVNQVQGTSGALFEISSPIIFMNKHLGSVTIGINRSVLVDAQQASMRKLPLAFVITLIVGMVGSMILSSVITRPIKELSSGVEEFKAGKRSRPLRVYSEDELGRLTRSFNEMTGLITEQQGKLSKYAQELETSYVSTVKVLAATIDARDPYTHGHSTRVSLFSLHIARKLGFTEEELEELEIACLFHDVGKIKTPDTILLKDGPLNASELREMMKHAVYGADILSKASSLHKYILPVRHHHEWFDGTGYPDGLSGDGIPIFASIISITDAFDAMTSNRPYRSALPVETAFNELAASSGRQFNPDLVKVFLEVADNKNLPALYHEGDG